MKQIYKICFTIILAISTTLSIGTTNINAKEVGKTVTIEADILNPKSYESTVTQLLSYDSVNEVIVIDNKLNNKFIENGEIFEQPILTPDAVTTYRYRITNVMSGSDYVGSGSIAIATGEPGSTISISKTSSVSNTYSLSASVVSASTVTTAVGFSVTSSESISISASDSVPSTHNGRQVKSMSLNAFPVYKTKSFTIERHKSVGGVNYGWSDYGSGTASQAYGISFIKTYVYK
ncbi:hypothetical protein acsn021_36770 [Anaerocolumna cellulosilytica]|uniref:Uncharacterized protein n=1 Tax=Anaerocolumna cellulosilytica TaxID=433286 RepID=A0A6S6RB05_9FIRM|nr:hypothetical protein [Anaerocolumna cellulosilytica]MBB5195055.1 hypothetical protein [Anaerocolumna cellulosilytica]BCJ96108.1 hypothetical protein acsn021_36770 [Anaerocolumna cellulosilytica]